jgi:hypothetical protein
MELKVKAVDSIESKSMQEVENELLEQHESELEQENVSAQENNTEEEKNEPPKENESNKKEEVVEAVSKAAEEELSDTDVLSYIEKRYGKKVNSIDELTQAREEAEPLPEDVAAYLEYKKQTGRGINDYVKLNKDFDSLSPDNLLREYLTATEEGLDPEDIQALMEDYEVDEEVEETAVVKKTRLAKKRKIAEAKKYFNEQKKLYKQPLESSPATISTSQLEDLRAYKQYVEDARTHEEANKVQRNWFTKQTDQVFNSEFKGFEFTIGDDTILYSPAEASELRKAQETPLNFVNRFIDEKGLMKDAQGYHRALALAMNPDKFARFFYEQGKSNATENVMRKTKNINMTERKTPEVVNKGGMQVKALTPSSGKGLRIRSLKRT